MNEITQADVQTIRMNSLIQTLEQQRNSAMSTAASLTADIAVRERLIAEQNKAVDEYRADQESLRALLKAQQAATEDLTHKLAAAQKDAAGLSTELIEARTQLAAAKSDRNVLQCSVDALEVVVDRMREQQRVEEVSVGNVVEVVQTDRLIDASTEDTNLHVVVTERGDAFAFAEVAPEQVPVGSALLEDATAEASTVDDLPADWAARTEAARHTTVNATPVEHIQLDVAIPRTVKFEEAAQEQVPVAEPSAKPAMPGQRARFAAVPGLVPTGQDAPAQIDEPTPDVLKVDRHDELYPPVSTLLPSSLDTDSAPIQ